MSSPLFQTHKLSVMFGGLTALIDLALEIREGEIVGLIGPNGAGKTTAFNAITGLIRPSDGKVYFKGQDITGRRAPYVARTGIGRTFQNIRLYQDLSVIENVMVAGHCSVRYGVLEAVLGLGRYAGEELRIRRQAEDLLDRMGLLSLAEEKAGALPYGSQRKLEVARALALEPELLLLDEPVAGMNPGETEGFRGLLKRLHAEFSLTVLLIEHDMGFVMKICDRIKVIDHGVSIAWGTPEQIQADPQVIAAYLGQG
ncbi:MAG: ABC transporter ATP-binding protein [Thermodesulfobacteriota bacterium]